MTTLKLLVTSEGEAESLLKSHFKTTPVRAGRDAKTQTRYWYVKGKHCTMKPTKTQTANGVKQYLVTVD